jgi:hypothetical protein
LALPDGGIEAGVIVEADLHIAAQEAGDEFRRGAIGDKGCVDPAALLNNSADRFWVLPGAIEAKLSLPGLALAAARMSPTVLRGPAALVAIRRSKKAVIVIGVKSRSTS